MGVYVRPFALVNVVTNHPLEGRASRVKSYGRWKGSIGMNLGESVYLYLKCINARPFRTFVCIRKVRTFFVKHYFFEYHKHTHRLEQDLLPRFW